MRFPGREEGEGPVCVARGTGQLLKPVCAVSAIYNQETRLR